jgi:HSP20 family protein
MLNDSFFAPFRAFDPLRELARLQAELGEGTGSPAFNVWTGQDVTHVTAELPGFKPDALDISVFGKTLTVKAEREPTAIEGTTAHRRERAYGRFERTIELPFRADAEKVEAKYVGGVLTVVVPRADADKRRTITINAN